jgi:Protein of unknown function (DUF3800)
MALSFINRLCLGIYHRDEPRRLFLMLGVYLDESGTHDGSALTIMSGWIASVEQWEGLERRWDALFRRFGVSYVHAKELRHREGPFRFWSDQKAVSFARELSAALEAHSQYSLTVILNNNEYESHYRAPDKAERKRRGSVDSKYGVCFRVFLSLVTQMVAKYMPGESLTVTLEAGHRNGGAAETIFAEFKQYAPELAGIVDAVAYVDKKKAAGVQAADFLAYPAYFLEQYKRAEWQPIDLPNMPMLTPGKMHSFRAPLSVETLKDIRAGQIAMAKQLAWMKRVERRVG